MRPLFSLKHLAAAYTQTIDKSTIEVDDSRPLAPYSPRDSLKGKSTREIIRDKVRSMSISTMEEGGKQ